MNPPAPLSAIDRLAEAIDALIAGLLAALTPRTWVGALFCGLSRPLVARVCEELRGIGPLLRALARHDDAGTPPAPISAGAGPTPGDGGSAPPRSSAPGEAKHSRGSRLAPSRHVQNPRCSPRPPRRRVPPARGKAAGRKRRAGPARRAVFFRPRPGRGVGLPIPLRLFNE